MSRATDIGACAWRISRLADDGTPEYNDATGAFVVCGGITAVKHDFEIEAGQKIFVKDSCGAACINVVRDDIEKWVNFEVTLCKDDYRIWEILGLADALTSAGEVVGRGHTMAAGCEVVSRARVALEFWSEQYDCDELVADFPYKRYVFTNAVLTPKGFDHNSDPSLPIFAGKAFNNANFTDGPFGDLDILVANSFAGAFAVVDDTDIPTCPVPLNYVPIPSSAS